MNQAVFFRGNADPDDKRKKKKRVIWNSSDYFNIVHSVTASPLTDYMILLWATRPCFVVSVWQDMTKWLIYAFFNHNSRRLNW